MPLRLSFLSNKSYFGLQIGLHLEFRTKVLRPRVARVIFYHVLMLIESIGHMSKIGSQIPVIVSLVVVNLFEWRLTEVS